MRIRPPSILVLILLATASPALTQVVGYRDPSPNITRILDAPFTPLVSVSPSRDWLLLVERPSMPSISEVAAPEVRLAGVRLNPRTNAPSRAPTFTGLSLLPVAGGAERRISVPEGGGLGGVMWSPDGARVAFIRAEGRGVALWVADVATGASRRITGPVVNAAAGSPCEWLRSNDGLLCMLIPEGRGAPPPEPETPVGPVIQESKGRSAPNRTYQDLLRDQHDEQLFEHYFTSRLAVVRLDGTTRPLGAPAIYINVGLSPDGRYLLVQEVHRPFSYLVTLGRFPLKTQVWDLDGRLINQIADLPLRDDVPSSFDAVSPGPRAVRWRSDAPATLVWSEALDGGDPTAAAAKRDKVVMLAAPFSGEPATLAEVEFRAGQTVWARADLAIQYEGWQKTRKARVWALNPSAPSAAPRLLFEYSSEDRMANPGRFLTDVGPLGTQVLQTTRDGRHAFLTGPGASSDGDRPFLDRFEIATGKTTRLFRSEAPFYEDIAALLDPEQGRLLTRRESVQEPPNYHLRDLRRNRTTQLTRLTDPAPAFAAVKKELVTYTRKDGVQLSATVYLPPGYQPSQGPLPFFFWAYPREFTTAAAASQITGSPYRFTRPGGSSHLFLLLAGYGVLDDPTMPIVAADGKEPNDGYVEQLVASAAAAVDKVVSMGIADRNRIAIGGHSYGAFMTANLLAHSDLFRAGIARSGAYNRTLTPFGFQSEERTYWEALEVYTKMSPFTYAHQIKEPILLIHGEADDNSGTFPVQSERMYAALKGNGGTVRYVVLPAEAHGYRARESVGHTLHEMQAWLDAYVKGERAVLTPDS